MGNKGIYIASFNRASDGALSKLIQALDTKDMLVENEPDICDYILAPGDRKETFEFCLNWYGKKPIIHLWAGENSNGTHDEIYRWAITQMSEIQLCTNDKAAERVMAFCDAIGKSHNVKVVGNVMLDNLPDNLEYDIVLYNPPTLLSSEEIENECKQITSHLAPIYFWLAPNGDSGSDIVAPFTNFGNIPRHMFLALVKHCRQFISNSSCIDYEIKHIIPEDRITRIGVRNSDRESIQADMKIPNATDNIMKVLEEL